MDYEKKYKEALEWARKVMQGKVGFVLDEVLEKFPELKESEDERVMRELIDYFGGTLNGEDVELPSKDTMERWVAWLEKQGEQKTTDKVEPKFKVGDYIINLQGTLRHIINVDKGGYQTDGGWLSHDMYEKAFHLWTIQDAKDGDVLATDTSVFIYAEVLYNKPYAYCGVDKFGVFKDNCRKNDWTNSVDNVHPSTKEQRDLLFQKMKDAGYEWDAEKKELKKIEQKPAGWNKNDEVILDETLHFIREFQQSDRCIDEGDMQNSVTCENWLKSLRPQSQWKPSESDILLLERIANGKSDPQDFQATLCCLIEQLKKLKG